MKAVVMAGGEGTRLRPLTSNQPKPMVPIVGKPCMEHILELLREHGLTEVIVTVAFLPQAIRGYFGDGDTLGMERRLLRRGVAARHRRLRPTRREAAGRDVPRHLRRRALRRRPEQADRVPQGARRGRHDRPQVRREPARVRDRRHRRGGEDRALPREAVMGSGLLGHDQHRHLRARARGAEARAYRPAVRLLEGALSVPARDGPAAVRLRHGRLLAGHRQPRPVPAGELRRARRERPPQHSRHPASAATSGSARASRSPTSTRSKGRRCIGNYCRIAPGANRRRVLRALEQRHAARAHAHDALRHRRVDAHRPQLADRGSDPRTFVRHPRARPHPRGRRGRRRGHDRLGERDHARRPDLPVQGGRVRLAHHTRA